MTGCDCGAATGGNRRGVSAAGVNLRMLADVLEDEQLTIVVDEALPHHAHRLMAALGVRVKVRRPDALAAEARRWLLGHDGPATRATALVEIALGRYYEDLAVVRGVRAWKGSR